MEKRKNLKVNFHFYEKLYFGGRIDDKRRTVNAIVLGGRLPRVYAILLSEKEGSLFDIYECTDNLYPLYLHEDAYIIGICRGRSNTMKLITEIIDTHQDELSDLKTYWKSRSFLSAERLCL